MGGNSGTLDATAQCWAAPMGAIAAATAQMSAIHPGVAAPTDSAAQIVSVAVIPLADSSAREPAADGNYCYRRYYYHSAA